MVNTTKVELHKRRVRLQGGRMTVYYTLRWHAPDGTRHSESCGDVTWAEAKERKRQKEANISNGAELAARPKRLTVAGLVEYHRQAKGPDLRPRTRLEYEYSAAHINRVLGAETPIDTLTSAHIGRLKAHLADERKARTGTVNKVLSHLRAMLNTAVRDRLLPRSPMQGTKLRTPEPKAARIYTKDDAKALVKAAPTDWWRAAIRLMFTSGLRTGELVNLAWSDVDLEAGTVTVRPKDAGTFSVNGREYRRFAWTAKSKAAYRMVPIPRDTAAALRMLHKQGDGSPYVFLPLDRLAMVAARQAAGTWRADARLCNNLLRGFRAIHRAAKLADPEGTVHDLRKSYGTMMAGVVPMPTLQRYMGHSNVATTCVYYTRERAEDADRARAAMQADAPDLRLVG